MSLPQELLLLPSLRAHRGPGGELFLTEKFLNGTAQYARHWPGTTRTLVFESSVPTGDMDHVVVTDNGPYPPVELRPADAADLKPLLSRAAAVMAFLSPYELPLAHACRDLGVPIVFTSEYSLRTEKQIVDAGTRNPVLRWRRKLWIRHAERVRLEILRMAAGIQCSGTPTYEQYRHVARDALLFFDNRVPCAHVVSEAAVHAKFRDVDSRPLRLVFGGRLVAMKGVHWLPKIASELVRLGARFTLDIVGKGELEPRLRQLISSMALENIVRLHGPMDFATGWVPMLKQRADLFVCPHLQGDPSSTYPEVLSCGVPIVGFDNEAFSGIVSHSHTGWLVRMGDIRGMAETIQRIDADRACLLPAALRGRTFAARHCFEKTFLARSRHLIALSRLPEDLRQGAGSQ